MEAENLQQQSCKQFLSLEINYSNSIRCIDLENTLSGFRMILQHELACRTGKSSRAFTDVTQIESIEKGSIVINMFFELININLHLVDFNINLLSFDIDALDIILAYLLRKKTLNEENQKLAVYLDGIKQALKNIDSFILKVRGRVIKLWCNQDGDIVASDITENHIGE